MVGERIWVESLLTEKELQACGFKIVAMFECEFKWRWDMGKALTPDKINLINTRIDNLRKLLTNES